MMIFSLKKLVACLFFISLLVALPCLYLFAQDPTMSKEDEPELIKEHVRTGEGIGVVVERLEGLEGIGRCKFCGQLIKAGAIHKDAAVIIEKQIKDSLGEMGLNYTSGKGKGKYLHTYIYRFEERRGGNFSVEKPAGIGFHMHLYEDNAIKKVFVYQEEQRPLSENVLNIGKFFKRGGKWITIDALSQEGVDKGLEHFSEDLK